MNLPVERVNIARTLALWSTPRTVSTAFDKMMRTRNDYLVRTEPFSIAYYLGPQRRSDRFATSEPTAGFDDVLAKVLEPSDRPVFVKEMAYQLGPLLRQDVLKRFHGSFLIRDPAYSLPSLARVWPDFTHEEAGYVAQHRAWTLLRAAGEEPPVIDSDDLRIDPSTVVGAWCDAVDIERRPDALVWEPGMPDEWKVWERWMSGAAESQGFLPPDGASPLPVSTELSEKIERCRPLYLEMHEHRIAA